MVELADIFTRHGSEYRQKFGKHMLPSHKRAMCDIEHCRTPAMGGSHYLCKDCGKEHFSFHSCGNRSCPKCANGQTTAWLAKQRDLLLPVSYFLATCTLPTELRALARSCQKTVYSITMRAFVSAMQKLALDPRHLGAHIGAVGILQTWRRDMAYHPHVHFILPAGGLSPDGKKWIHSKYIDFLLPEKPLAIVFRAKFRDELKKAGLFDNVPASVWQKDWVVDFEPVGNAEGALKYIAPYVYRVAISNNRIESLADGKVTFRYTDANSGTIKRITLPAEHFIARFLQHVLPKGFQKVRYYGFLAPRSRHLLQLVRTLLGSTPEPRTSPPTAKLHFCPHCGGQLLLLGLLPKQRGPP